MLCLSMPNGPVSKTLQPLYSRKPSFARVAPWITIGAVDAIDSTLPQPFHSATENRLKLTRKS